MIEESAALNDSGKGSLLKENSQAEAVQSTRPAKTSADYKHIDGLRGLGALFVYHSHFVELLIEPN